MSINDSKEALERRIIDTSSIVNMELDAIISEDKKEKGGKLLNAKKIEIKRGIESFNERKALEAELNYLDL